MKLVNTDRGHDGAHRHHERLRDSTPQPALPLGTYTVQITDQGFKTENVKGLVLHVSDALTVNRLAVDGQRQRDGDC